jgi:hypothetical protein
VPAAVPTTLTVKVHGALSARVAPDTLTLEDPGCAVIVPPPQLPVRPLGVETTRPEGKVSITPTSVRDPFVVVFGFVMPKLRDVKPPTRMEGAPNASLIAGGATTVMLSDAGAPFPPCAEVTRLVVLFSTAAVAPVTFTLKLQLAPALRVAPDRLMLADPPAAVIVPPPQLPLRPLGVETTSPAGSGSVNPTPLSATAPLELLIVNARLVLEFNGMVFAPKPAARLGGATTARLADAATPLPSLDVTALLTLFLIPAVIPVTLTENVQLAAPANAAPDRLRLDDPPAAVIVPRPQLPVRPLGVETTRPAGRGSVNPTPLSVTVPLGLLMLNFRLVLVFNGIVAAPKTSARLSGAAMVRLAEAATPLPPCVEVTRLVVLFSTAAVAPVTFTVKLQLAAALRVAPDRPMLDDPPLAVIVPPPQLPLSPLGVETTSPAGSESVNPTPLSATVPLELLIVNVRLVLEFSGIVVAPKTSARLGGATTVRLADAAPPFPSLDAKALLILFLIPAVMPVTLTENVQLAVLATAAFDRLMLADPAAAVIAPPPQLPFKPFGLAITSPAGNASLNPTPDRANDPLGLLIVNVRLVLEFNGIVDTPNVLPIVGDCGETALLVVNVST